MLFVRALRIALCHHRVVERLGRDRCRVLQQAAHVLAARRWACHEIVQGLLRLIDLRQIGVARRRGMVRLEQTEERPCRLAPRLHSDDLGLDHRAGDLVLESLTRQIKRGVGLA